ncbi:MAG: discoidin domain-containing protein, partial [Oscillospiraceae bacterium]|nr:discoidin domain-containing protein [Oscillospiraceae bacterium]
MGDGKSILDYATIEGRCGGVPIYSFNHLAYVYGEAPDLYPGVRLQEGNLGPIAKVRLKKSWEIGDNFIGICHEMTPRNRMNDCCAFLPVHLIDGDPRTVWASFETLAPDARPEWVRIDLPMDAEVSRVVLSCNKRYMGKDRSHAYRPGWHFGNALPRRLSLKTSRDAWHWRTALDLKALPIYQAADGWDGGPLRNEGGSAEAVILGDPANPDGILIEMDCPVKAKQVMLCAEDFPRTGYEGHMWSLSGLDVYGPDGRNLSLISTGAGVTVSSTSNAHYTDKYSADSLWGPMQYDLGVKWVKVGSDNGSGMWCFTEHEKGRLQVDDVFRAAMEEAAGHGIKI